MRIQIIGIAGPKSEPFDLVFQNGIEMQDWIKKNEDGLEVQEMVALDKRSPREERLMWESE